MVFPFFFFFKEPYLIKANTNFLSNKEFFPTKIEKKKKDGNSFQVVNLAKKQIE